ncbi:MAG: hypothetical protein EZS28_040944, partial [Streblomastix strix]
MIPPQYPVREVDDDSSPKFDLSGMKILGNTADKGGQSIYIIMSELQELCRIGTAGE